MTKIRWYHLAIYRIFYMVWTPILLRNPKIVKAFRDHADTWLKNNGYY